MVNEASSSVPMDLQIGIVPEEEEELLRGYASGWVEARTSCDHLSSPCTDLSHIPAPDTSCFKCHHTDENWLCLCCKDVFCSRFVNKHMVEHNKESNHCLVLSYRCSGDSPASPCV